jgi:predicted phage tail protein
MSATKKVEALIASFEKTASLHKQELQGTAEQQMKKMSVSANEQRRLIEDTQHQLSSDLKKEAEELSKSANNEHAARVRFYGKKSEQLDGQVAEATKSIKSEEKAAVVSIKKVYGKVAIKLRDVGTDIANGLLNHPVADTIKTFWAQMRRKEETPQETHPVETSPKLDTGTFASPSVKTPRSASSKRSSRSSKNSRLALSPLQMVANLPRSAQKKRVSDELASPVSKSSYVTPSQVGKRRKSVVPSARFSSASAMTASKRGRFGKARSAFSQNSSQMEDGDCAFLSQY